MTVTAPPQIRPILERITPTELELVRRAARDGTLPRRSPRVLILRLGLDRAGARRTLDETAEAMRCHESSIRLTERLLSAFLTGAAMARCYEPGRRSPPASNGFTARASQ